jgi:ribosomal protein L11
MTKKKRFKERRHAVNGDMAVYNVHTITEIKKKKLTTHPYEKMYNLKLLLIYGTFKRQ